MKSATVYLFLLWDNCNNNCLFCFQHLNSRFFSYLQKQKVLTLTINFINSNNFVIGSHVLIIGGLIFYNKKDKDILLLFFTKLIYLMQLNIINLLYINTNLLYKNLDILLLFLLLINKNNLFHRLRFTSSYDIFGRFKSKLQLILMLNNLKLIYKLYSKIEIVINCILTKQMCNAILANEFNPIKFMKEYHCWINFIPYIIYSLNLIASRNLIFKTLLKINANDNLYLYRYIHNLDLNQLKKLYIYKNNQYNNCSCKINLCGHPINFTKYSLQKTCFICDLKEIFKSEI